MAPPWLRQRFGVGTLRWLAAKLAARGSSSGGEVERVVRGRGR
jgi:hypothetical protein